MTLHACTSGVLIAKQLAHLEAHVLLCLRMRAPCYGAEPLVCKRGRDADTACVAQVAEQVSRSAKFERQVKIRTEALEDAQASALAAEERVTELQRRVDAAAAGNGSVQPSGEDDSGDEGDQGDASQSATRLLEQQGDMDELEVQRNQICCVAMFKCGRVRACERIVVTESRQACMLRQPFLHAR